MTDTADPWAAFPDAPGAKAPSSAPATAPSPQAIAPQAAPQGGGSDPWAAFPDAPAAKTYATAPDQPALATSGAPPGHFQNFSAGFLRGLQDVGDVAKQGVTALANLPPIKAIDTAVPFLGRLDSPTQGYGDNPQARAESAASYEKQYGGSPLAGIGRFGGQVTATLPATMGIGAAGDVVGNVVGRAPGYIGPTLNILSDLASGAGQGAAAAELTGGNPYLGAAGGFGSKATGIGLSHLTYLPARVGDYLVKAASGVAGYHFGDIGGAYLSEKFLAPVLEEITRKFGGKMAGAVADGLNAANNYSVLPTMVGIEAGKYTPYPYQSGGIPTMTVHPQPSDATSASSDSRRQ